MPAKTHLYVGILLCLAIILGTLKIANAQSTEDLIPNPVPNPSVAMHEVGSIFSGSSGITHPTAPANIEPAPPPIDQNNFTQAQLDKLALAQAGNKNSVKAGCTGFELYSDSMLCNQFGSHQEAEQHYYHCSLNNYQLALRNGELEAKCGYGAPSASVCMDAGKVADGGGLWKPVADPKARCKNGTTILLDKKYDGVDAMQILDNNKQFIMDATYYGKLADGRPRFCAEGRPGSSFGSGPIYTKYNSNGISECRLVSNPANRED